MADIDPKSKKEVLEHMNADHKVDLGLFLRNYNGLSAAELEAAGEPEMVDVDLKSITIRTATDGQTRIVAIDPPMKSWSERRVRIVTMGIKSRIAFGVAIPHHGSGPKGSPIPFSPPAGFDIVVFAMVVGYAITVGQVLTGHDEPISSWWSRGLAAVGVPPPGVGPQTSQLSSYIGGAEGFRWITKKLALPVLAIHCTEVVVMYLTRLAPHGMSLLHKDTLLWMGSTFWEGVCAFFRFDRKAAKAEKEKAAVVSALTEEEK